MAAKGYRTFVKLDAYELALLRKLKQDLGKEARNEGRKPPAMVDVIRGCIRTAIHTVYGEDIVYRDLLSSEEFKQQMGPFDSSLLDED
jgi:hypothetical protein